MDPTLIILTFGSIVGCFSLGFSLGTYLERKRIISQYEWDLNIMERLSRIEDTVSEFEEYEENELDGIKLIRIQFNRTED